MATRQEMRSGTAAQAALFVSQHASLFTCPSTPLRITTGRGQTDLMVLLRRVWRYVHAGLHCCGWRHNFLHPTQLPPSCPRHNASGLARLLHGDARRCAVKHHDLSDDVLLIPSRK